MNSVLSAKIAILYNHETFPHNRKTMRMTNSDQKAVSISKFLRVIYRYPHIYGNMWTATFTILFKWINILFSSTFTIFSHTETMPLPPPLSVALQSLSCKHAHRPKSLIPPFQRITLHLCIIIFCLQCRRRNR